MATGTVLYSTAKQHDRTAGQWREPEFARVWRSAQAGWWDPAQGWAGRGGPQRHSRRLRLLSSESAALFDAPFCRGREVDSARLTTKRVLRPPSLANQSLDPAHTRFPQYGFAAPCSGGREPRRRHRRGQRHRPSGSSGPCLAVRHVCCHWRPFD